MSYPGGWRPHIESARLLDIWRMDTLRALRDGARGAWQWTRDGELVASIGYSVRLGEDTGTLTLNYSHEGPDGEREDVECVVRLSSIELHYGGRRWYAHCPYTGRRARKLYKFHGIAKFCHRTAVRPSATYASQRVSGADRAITQRWLLRRRMGDQVSGLFDGPIRPKRMRHRTFQSYVDRDDVLAEREGRYMGRHLSRLIARLD